MPLKYFNYVVVPGITYSNCFYGCRRTWNWDNAKVYVYQQTRHHHISVSASNLFWLLFVLALCLYPNKIKNRYLVFNFEQFAKIQQYSYDCSVKFVLNKYLNYKLIIFILLKPYYDSGTKCHKNIFFLFECICYNVTKKISMVQFYGNLVL